MSEETKNTAELTAEQLEKVAGGEGGETKSFYVKNHNGATIYRARFKSSLKLGSYLHGKTLYNCAIYDIWVFVPSDNGLPDGYVLKSDLGLF